MTPDNPSAKVTISADLSEYGYEVEIAIKDCIRTAVHEAIYDVIKADVRRAFMASSLKDKLLPKVVDETLKRMAREVE